MASSVDLGPHLEAFMTKLVEKGRYGSKSEILREGVRLIEEREARLAALDADIRRGLQEAAAGDFEPADEFFARLRAKYESMK
jgi:antitoxin ParD1/3/4